MKAFASILPGGTAGWRVTRSALLPVIALIVVLMIIGVSVSDRFGTARNLWNVYEQSTGLALVSLGQTLVILTGGIDLSVDGDRHDRGDADLGPDRRPAGAGRAR